MACNGIMIYAGAREDSPGGKLNFDWSIGKSGKTRNLVSGFLQLLHACFSDIIQHACRDIIGTEHNGRKAPPHRQLILYSHTNNGTRKKYVWAETSRIVEPRTIQ